MSKEYTIHEKSRGEKIKVYFGEYKGTHYLHIREWYFDPKDQEDKPTKKGVAIPLDKIEALLEAIEELGNPLEEKPAKKKK